MLSLWYIEACDPFEIFLPNPMILKVTGKTPTTVSSVRSICESISLGFSNPVIANVSQQVFLPPPH